MPEASLLFDIGNPPPYLSLGGGVEFGLGRSLSVFAETVMVRDPFEYGGLLGLALQGGVNFHFGN